MKSGEEFDWNLTIHNENQHTTSYDTDGFEIQSHEIGTEKFCIRLLATHWTVFYFDVRVKRQISQYIFQYYIPSITIVIASSVSFIIPLSAIPGRVALVVTQFLTLTNIFIHQMVIYLLRILANIGKLITASLYMEIFYLLFLDRQSFRRQIKCTWGIPLDVFGICFLYHG